MKLDDFFFLTMITIGLILFGCNFNSKLDFKKYNYESSLRLGITNVNPSNVSQDSLKNYKLSETFIVGNYNDTEENEKVIDDFVCNYVRDIVDKYKGYTITFYKRTSKTNLEYLSEHPNYFSESFAIDYLWHYNFDMVKGFLGKVKVKNTDSRKFFFETPSCWEQNKRIMK